MLFFLGFMLLESFDYALWEGLNRVRSGQKVMPYKELRDGFLADNYKLLFLNQRENAHMEDVRVLLFYGSIAFSVFLLVLILFLEDVKSINKRYMFLTGLIASLVIILLFPLLFVAFHQLLFKEGSWIFPSSSLLIRAFPSTFFLVLAVRALILAFILSLIILKFNSIT